MRRLGVTLAISLTCTACSGPDSDLPRAYQRVEVPEERLQSGAAVARGEIVYEKNCILCHGERGSGRGRRSAGFRKKPTRFADREWRRRMTARRAFFIVREGVQGTPMPSWSWLSEEETWDVVAYVLSLARKPASGATSSSMAHEGRESIVGCDKVKRSGGSPQSADMIFLSRFEPGGIRSLEARTGARRSLPGGRGVHAGDGA